MAVASIPLLYETQREKDFDFVVVTVCPPDVQLERLLERDRMSEEEAHQRIAAQIPAEEKAARADFVILTGGTMLATDRQVDNLVVALERLITRGS
jgi:dephospho-CoA kinase